ncbi:MAG: hypothetical protein WA667_27535 [Candidatus Nitrosopolaris sp.]
MSAKTTNNDARQTTTNELELSSTDEDATKVRRSGYGEKEWHDIHLLEQNSGLCNIESYKHEHPLTPKDVENVFDISYLGNV